jgi:hypothetical protein
MSLQYLRWVPEDTAGNSFLAMHVMLAISMLPYLVKDGFGEHDEDPNQHEQLPLRCVPVIPYPQETR